MDYLFFYPSPAGTRPSLHVLVGNMGLRLLVLLKTLSEIDFNPHCDQSVIHILHEQSYTQVDNAEP